MQTVTTFDPSNTTSGRFDTTFGGQATESQLYVWNDSNAALSFQLASGKVLFIPPGVGYPIRKRPYPVPVISWTQVYLLSGAAIASRVTVEIYEPGEPLPSETPVPIIRNVNVGNTVNTGSSVGTANQVTYDQTAINGETASSITSSAAAGGAAPLVNVTDANPTGGMRKFVMKTGEVDIAGDGTITGKLATVNSDTGKITSDGAGNLTTGSVFGPLSTGVDSTGALNVKPGNTTTPSPIIVGTAGFGVKMNGNTPILEVRADGSLEMGKNQLYYPQATSTLNWAQRAFDAFDVAEVYPTDPKQRLRGGEVVCPDARSIFHRCTHTNCPRALIVSERPALRVGRRDGSPHTRYLALAGRVRVRCTAASDAEAVFVVSDGAGKAHALAPGAWGHALGIVLPGSYNAQSRTLGIIVRPQYVRQDGQQENER